MTWAAFFHRKPRCMECRTTEHLHLVESGLHKGYVCSTCAVTTGYVEFLPSLQREIIYDTNIARPEQA